MPFDARNLAAFIVGDTTTLWFYSTTDARAAVLAPGYFSGAADRLDFGSVILAQTADAIAWLPVRANGAVGDGLVLDATVLPLRLNAQATAGFAFDQTGAATARSVGLLPLDTVFTGRAFNVVASASGAVGSVTFRLLDAANAQLGAPLTAAVADGFAQVSFTAPAAGIGYRIRAEDPAEPMATTLSPPFAASAPYALLREPDAANLLLETGGALLL